MGTNDKAWDIGFHREIGDESNPTWSVVVGGTSNALHVIDPAHIGTDFNVSAATVPTLYIHGSATAPTEYVKIYHNETDAFFDVAGGNAVVKIPTAQDFTVQIASTDEYVFDSATANFNSNILGSLGTSTFLGQINAGSQIINGAGNIIFVTGRTITGTNLVISAPGTAVQMSNAASWNANGTGTATLGAVFPGASATVGVWMKVLDNVGSLYYIPAFGL